MPAFSVESMELPEYRGMATRTLGGLHGVAGAAKCLYRHLVSVPSAQCFLDLMGSAVLACIEDR